MSGFIDVWCGNILNAGCDFEDQGSYVSADELKYAETLKNPVFKEKYLNTRQKLRLTLAKYLKSEAKEIAITRNQYGKPYLDGGQFFFNISHSGDKLAIAVSDINEVGVDIERCKVRRGMVDLAKRCFAGEEIVYWNRLPDDAKHKQFYKFWTGKEAYVKATGRGIALGLDRCVINPEYPAKFLRVPDGYGESSQWRILDFDLEGDYCGAVVIQNADRHVRLNMKSLDSI